MSLGVWLTKTECFEALKLSQMQFEHKYASKLPFKLIGSRKKYFLTKDLMPKGSQKAYSDKFIEYDEDSQEVEDILGDISAPQSGSKEYEAARLENLRARTAVLQEKLEARKRPAVERME